MEQNAKILIQFPWAGDDKKGNGYIISKDYALEEADALLVEWQPTKALWSFPRRKIWYCCEPPFQIKVQQGGAWLEFISKLPANEYIWHNHPQEKYRVPHASHHGKITPSSDKTVRSKQAVAIVSNFGNTPRRRPRDFYYRNRLITHTGVDLFGRSWHLYRKHLFSRAKEPANYCGQIPGDWTDDTKRQLLTQYHACLCLENHFQPNYFTEKFVEAATAGCVPIYRAHPTVRDTILQGAMWIDPQDHGNDPNRTLAAARTANRVAFQEANNTWMLESKAFQATHADAIYARLADILLND